MKIVSIRFEGDYLYGMGDDGVEYRQSLLWYPRLRVATELERAQYHFGLGGIHWRGLDEDVSFESFEYADAEPSELQRFFLMHKEINVAEFAKRIGINASLLRNYINGFKQPSEERKQLIMEGIRAMGAELMAVRF